MGFKDNTYIKIDTSQIPFNSILENADQASKLIANTICNPDEVRNLFGFDDINEDFSKSYFITKNNSKAEDVMNNVSENGKE